jgi:hypothetical protein
MMTGGRGVQKSASGHETMSKAKSLEQHLDISHSSIFFNLYFLQQKTKTTKTLKELVGFVEFCRLLRPWEEREQENAQAREGEET